MLRKNLFVLISVLVVLSMVLVGCGNDLKQETTSENEELLIYTSMYPLYDFTSKIAGDKAKVINLVPSGAEPHDFEPTPKDIVELSKADLFVYNGGGFETWIERIVESVQVNNPELVLVDTTANIHLLSPEETGLAQGHDEEHEDEEGHDEHGDEEAHEHGQYDPHVWLDPVLAKQQAEAIKDALVQLDPNNASYYENNFKELANRFDELDSKFQELTHRATKKDFIVSHAAFGYLAKRYQLNQVAIAGLSPSVEPSTQELKEVIEFAQENQIEYIMFENLVTPKVAEAVRQEIKAESLVLYTIEVITKEEESQGKDYFTLMEENLEAFKKALGFK